MARRAAGNGHAGAGSEHAEAGDGHAEAGNEHAEARNEHAEPVTAGAATVPSSDPMPDQATPQAAAHGAFHAAGTASRPAAASRHLAVYISGGIGDTLMHLGFVKALADHAGAPVTLVLATPPVATPLLLMQP